jgi:hypothetical protein
MLIGIYSSTPQSGKSTVAHHLVMRHNFERVPFADVLKAMMHPVLEALDVDAQELYTGDKSAVVYKDKTLRHALQTLGTEWGRKCMGENFWVDMWKRQVSMAKSVYGSNIVVDDMRFPNEFEAVRSLGGWTWKVARPGATAPTNGHASEGALDNLLFDTELVNAGTLHDLEDTVEAALRAGGR